MSKIWDYNNILTKNRTNDDAFDDGKDGSKKKL